MLVSWFLSAFLSLSAQASGLASLDLNEVVSKIKSADHFCSNRQLGNLCSAYRKPLKSTEGFIELGSAAVLVLDAKTSVSGEIADMQKKFAPDKFWEYVSYFSVADKKFVEKLANSPYLKLVVILLDGSPGYGAKKIVSVGVYDTFQLRNEVTSFGSQMREEIAQALTTWGPSKDIKLVYDFKQVAPLSL